VLPNATIEITSLPLQSDASPTANRTKRFGNDPTQTVHLCHLRFAIRHESAPPTHATRFFFGAFKLSFRAAVRSITLVEGGALAGALIFWPLAFASITFLTSSA
jgi:hypothetical protein